MDVPCGDCRGCCTSAYFIPISPDEKEALNSIPKKLLFKAPGLPKGYQVLGYCDNGHCPMFIENKCSIYHARPLTCRQYDCRVFAATGLDVGEDKPRIAAQAKRWRFDFAKAADSDHFGAVQAAAKFLNRYAETFPPGFLPGQATQRAMLAIKVYGLFLKSPVPARPSEKWVRERVGEIVGEAKKSTPSSP